MRLFIAAELPDELVCALSETSAALRESVRGRFVAPDSYHVTLAFIGELEGSRITEVEEALASACEGVDPIPVELGELGSFGRPRKATLWQAVCDPTGELARLATRLREGLSHAGVPFDGKAFKAHVTLMRSADLSGGVLPPATFAQGPISSVALFSSDLSGARPRYAPLTRFELV